MCDHLIISGPLRHVLFLDLQTTIGKESLETSIESRSANIGCHDGKITVCKLLLGGQAQHGEVQYSKLTPYLHGAPQISRYKSCFHSCGQHMWSIAYRAQSMSRSALTGSNRE